MIARSRSADRLAAALVVAVVLLASAHHPTAAAHEPPRLGLTPVGDHGTYFQLPMDPGDTRRLEVEAANFGEAESRARTYAADVYTIVNGGFGADLFGEEATGATSWIAYPSQEMSLAPGDALVIPFEVTVPDDTAPGEYVAALVIENAEPVRSSGSVAIDQVNRSAIAVAIDVPGPRAPGLAIGAVGHKTAGERSVVTFEVLNTGNVHLRPAGDFRLRGADGTELSAATLTMDSVYAGTSTILEAPLSGLLPPGDYCAELSLADAEHGVSAETDCLSVAVRAGEDADAGGAAPGSQDLTLRLPSTDGPLAAALIATGAAIVSALIAVALVLGVRRRRREAKTQLRPPGAAARSRTGS